MVGSVHTRGAPTKMMLQRLIALASASLAACRQKLEGIATQRPRLVVCSLFVPWVSQLLIPSWSQSLFTPNLSSYDILIHIDPSALTRGHYSLQSATSKGKETRRVQKWLRASKYKNLDKGRNALLAGFDPCEFFLGDLKVRSRLMPLRLSL